MITFRFANLNDLAAINRLVNSAYRGEYAKQGWTTEAGILDGQRTDEKAIQSILETPQNEILLALIDSEIVGCVHLNYESTESVYFGMLTVEPKKQALGLGKKILEQIEILAKARGLKQIRIHVIPLRTELIAYYERRGFKPTGIWEEFPNDPRNGIPKTEGLRLDEYVKLL